MRTKLIYFLLPMILVTATILLVSSRNNAEQEKLKDMGRDMSKVSLNPPANLTFAGEKIPTQDYEVAERLDKELIKNIYFHSASILTLKRSGRWKNEMCGILKQYGVPEDFFYLCIAESQLTNVTSPAGAKGFWQFMEGTARNYGLVIDERVDERLDPIKSTHAAAKYLLEAHRKFGNWTLVAASYNMGIGGVESELARQKVKNYYDLYLNSETAAYVFRLLAIKAIMENPVAYGFDLEPGQIYTPVKYRTVKVNKTIDNLIDFALQCGTTYKMMKVMNPWILTDKLIVKEGETWSVHIPIETDFSAEELMVNESGGVVPAVDSVKVDSGK